MNDNELIDHLIKAVSDKPEEKKSPVNFNGHEDQESIIERPLKSIVFNAQSGKLLDENIVTYQLYNSFNYSLFLNKGEHKKIKCMLGVTSANEGEGKTTTACNLAAALSLSLQCKTVLIDLNTNRPRIHEIFGTPKAPGISEALFGDDIFVTPTKIDNLAILPSGSLRVLPLNRLTNFRIIANSLLHSFEFVIVDMTSVDSKNFPTLIANQLNGLIVVVESNRTRRRDINRLFRRVNEKNVVGFVMNRINEEDF